MSQNYNTYAYHKMELWNLMQILPQSTEKDLSFMKHTNSSPSDPSSYIGMRQEKEKYWEKPTGIVYDYHLSPYDIQQNIFDSTNNNIIFCTHYIESP